MVFFASVLLLYAGLSEALICQQGYSVKSKKVSEINREDFTTEACSSPYHICRRTELSAVADVFFKVKATVIYAKCEQRGACSETSCDSARVDLETALGSRIDVGILEVDIDDIKIKKCRFKCCDTDRCNEKDIDDIDDMTTTLPTTTTSTTTAETTQASTTKRFNLRIAIENRAAVSATSYPTTTGGMSDEDMATTSTPEGPTVVSTSSVSTSSGGETVTDTQTSASSAYGTRDSLTTHVTRNSQTEGGKDSTMSPRLVLIPRPPWTASTRSIPHTKLLPMKSTASASSSRLDESVNSTPAHFLFHRTTEYRILSDSTLSASGALDKEVQESTADNVSETTFHFNRTSVSQTTHFSMTTNGNPQGTVLGPFSMLLTLLVATAANSIL